MARFHKYLELACCAQTLPRVFHDLCLKLNAINLSMAVGVLETMLATTLRMKD